MTSASFDSSAATRALSLLMKRMTTFAQGSIALQYFSLRSSTISWFGTKRTQRYGPVPIDNAPELKPSSGAPSTSFDDTMPSVDRFDRRSAEGSAVRI